jgi:hypothetical protein
LAIITRRGTRPQPFAWPAVGLIALGVALYAWALRCSRPSPEGHLAAGILPGILSRSHLTRPLGGPKQEAAG